MKYAYYPGCSLKSTAKEYDSSVKAVCRELGIELEEIDDWNCCGASPGHETSYWLAHALAGRNLALAERQGMDIAVACPACLSRLKTTRYEAASNADMRKKLSKILNMPYKAKYDVKHILEIISRDIGVEEVKRKVRNPLHGLKLVCYYGCFLVRPPKIAKFDDPENPQSLDILMEALGAKVIDWSGKVDCCGGSVSLARGDIVSKLVGGIVDMAKGAGADAIVTACPLCHTNLETRQGGRNMPIFYFTELMGLAFGCKGADAWLKKHLISPSSLRLYGDFYYIWTKIMRR